MSYLTINVTKILENGEIEGCANFKMVDRYDELILPSAFTKTVALFMDNPVFLWAHDYYLPPIGSILKLEIRNDGLYFKAKFAGTAFAQELRLLYQEGHLRAFSIGFITKASRTPDENEIKEFGDSLRRMITELELLEISAVPVPANPKSLATSVKTYQESDLNSFDKLSAWIKDLRATEEKPPAEPEKPEAPAPASDTTKQHCAELKGHLTAVVKAFNAMESHVMGQKEEPKPAEETPEGSEGGKGAPSAEFKKLLEEINSLL